MRRTLNFIVLSCLFAPLTSGANPLDPYVLPEGYRAFVIENNDIVGDCSADDITKALVNPRDNSDPSLTDDDQGEFTAPIVRLRRATCLYHTQSVDPNSQDFQGMDQNDQRKVNDLAAEQLSISQKLGLPPIHQNYASLLQGLFHCRQARLNLDQYLQDKTKVTWNRRFCASRRRAVGSFGDVNWALAHFDISPTWHDKNVQNGDTVGTPHANPKNFSMAAVLNEYAACYNETGPLSQDYNSDCSVINSLTDTQINTLARDTVAKIEDEYLGNHSRNRVTTMMSNKKKRVKKVETTSASKIKDLETDAGNLQKSYQDYQTAYNTHVVEADRIVGEYRQASSKVLAIKEALDMWIDGLLDDESKGLLTQSQQTEEGIDTQRILEALAKAKRDLKSLKTVSKDNKEYAKKLCSIYYCQVKSKMQPFYSMTNILCNQSSFSLNPLCKANPDLVDDDGKVDSLKNICMRTGLSEQYAVTNLAASRAQDCAEDLAF